MRQFHILVPDQLAKRIAQAIGDFGRSVVAYCGIEFID